jgi:exopolysaccharide biosynthesis polyprenyl glycosylphosphotransferase
MIRRHAAVFRLTLMVADIVLALAVVVGATNLRFGHGSEGLTALYGALPNTGASIAVFIGTWVALLWLHGLYRPRTRWTLRGELGEVVRATAILIAITLSLLYLFKLPDVSRLLLIFVFPLLAAAAFGVRIAMRLVLAFLRKRGRNVRYMLVLGANARAKSFADLVESHTELGLIVIGHLQAGPTDDGVHLGRPCLGQIDDLETILHGQIVDEVAICLPFAQEELIEQAAHLCEQEGKAVRIPVAPVERVLTLGRLETIDGIGVYSLVNGPDRALGLLTKRILDLTTASLTLVVLSPLLLLLAVLIRLDSKGPVLFRQERVGLHGRTFKLVKFRSMVADAEARLDELRDLNEVRGCAFKLQADPRITRMGRVLRRTSLDELPQLWNVLRGQMSLVGPRPPLPAEVAGYDVWHRRRLSMKPGMTGLWQIGARRDPEFDRWVEKDLEYIDDWSLWLDLKIIARTVPAILGGEGR